MKKKIMLALALCSLLAVNKVYAQPVDTAFTDDNFYKCVIDNYNGENGTSKTVSDILNDEQIQTIEHLICNNENIKEINGIERLKSLQTVDLKNNEITTISPLINSNSTILEKIDISNNNIKWLYITNLPTLNELDISDNGMEHLILGNYIQTLRLDGNNFMKNIYLNLKNEKSVNVYDYILFDNIGATTDRLTIEYDIEDETIAKKEQEKITAQKEGTTQAKLKIKNGERIIYGQTPDNTSNSTITVQNTCMPLTTGARRYTVTFETNGGKELESIGTTIMLGIDPKEEKLELPTPTKEGYKFIGWYTDKDLKNKANIKSYGDIVNLENINEDECSAETIVRLYAKWDKSVENPKTGVVSYGTAGLLALVTLSGTYVLYKNKISKI